jgi:hypothetical protein
MDGNVRQPCPVLNSRTESGESVILASAKMERNFYKKR